MYLPLEGHQLFHTTDLDDARDKVGKIFSPHLLDMIGRDRDLDARMCSKRLGDTSLNLVEYGGNVRIVPGKLTTYTVVQIPLTGRAVVDANRDRVYAEPGTATVISPTDPLAMQWSAECRKLIVRIEQPALHARVSEMTGEPIYEPLRFEPAMNVATGYGASWYRMLKMMVEEVDAPGALIEQPDKAAQFEDRLIRLLLEVQPHNYSDKIEQAVARMHRRGAPTYSRHVRDAKQLIDSHPEWDHSTTSLASEVGYHPRTLQAGFKRQLGMAPRDYLTQVRLQRVRDELLAAPPEVQVHEIASRWGFTHFGRFAEMYRKAFHELPRETRRRSA